MNTIAENWKKIKDGIDDSFSNIEKDYKEYKFKQDVKKYTKKLTDFIDDANDQLEKSGKEFKKELASLEAELKKSRSQKDGEKKEKKIEGKIENLKKDFSDFSDKLKDSMKKTETYFDYVKKKH